MKPNTLLHPSQSGGSNLWPNNSTRGSWSFASQWKLWQGAKYDSYKTELSGTVFVRYLIACVFVFTAVQGLLRLET